MNLTVEQIHVCYYSEDRQLLLHWVAAEGTKSGASVPLRDLFEKAYEVGAHGMLLLHNHPYGNARPSKSDDEFTEVVRHWCQKTELTFLGHIVVGEDETFTYGE